MKNKLFQSQYAPEESPGFLLWQVTNLWQRRLNTQLKKLNLTHVQFVLLANTAFLTRDGKSVTQTQIAQQTKVHVMMVSQVIRTLEKKGLVKRVNDLKDTRAKFITVTKDGMELAIEAIRVVEHEDNNFFALSKTDMNSFIKSLSKLVTENS